VEEKVLMTLVSLRQVMVLGMVDHIRMEAMLMVHQALELLKLLQAKVGMELRTGMLPVKAMGVVELL